jgi:predicted nuclease of predicted toxin-antitoxin system
LLRLAQEQGRIFVTRDRDFGNLVFAKAIEAGVLYLRMTPATQNTVLDELERVLNKYSEQELLKSFVVIEADGHRMRKLPRQ